MSETRREFWGKYRAQVESNADDYKIGRLKLRIPDVLGTRISGWALPAFALASAGLTPGGGVGLFLVPPKDAWVWAEFEHGNPNHPIWTGCFFPPEAQALSATMTALAPLVGVDPEKAVLKLGKWVVTFDGDTLSIEHLEQVLPRARLKLDGQSIKLTTEQVPGAAAPTCAVAELGSSNVTINGMAINIG
jgi:Type VI secretion system/phage-baseplate injector OB domain